MASKLNLGLLVMVLFLLGTCAGAADFPGKGERALWTKANDIYNTGLELDKKQSIDLAIAKFREAIHIYPYDGDYYNCLGVDLKKVGNYQEAEVAYKKAISLNGDNWRYWNNLVNVLFVEKRYEQSRAACSKALMLNPPKLYAERLREKLRFLDERVKSSRVP